MTLKKFISLFVNFDAFHIILWSFLPIVYFHFSPTPVWNPYPLSYFLFTRVVCMSMGWKLFTGACHTLLKKMILSHQPITANSSSEKGGICPFWFFVFSYCVFYLHVRVPCACVAGFLGGQKKVLDSLKELQTILSCFMGSRNRTQVL